MHIEDRWTSPTGKVDTRGRPLREPNDRWKIGKRWLATWTEGGQRKAMSFENKDQASAHLGEVARAKREGTHVNSHKTTVAEYGDQWITSQIHQRPNSATQMEIRWRVHIRPTLGHLPLREVQRQHIQSAVQKWMHHPHDLAPATIAVTYGYVASLFKSAVQDRLIAATPCVRINKPPVIRERVVPLETHEVLTIADRIHPRFRTLILFGAATGMRSGELTGLTIDRLKWADPLSVRIDRQLATTQPTWGRPKTNTSDRTVTVDDVAAGMLQYHMLRWAPHDSGLIFTGHQGGPLSRTTIAEAWNQAIDGLASPALDSERSGLHALRHYHASLLIAAGLSVTAVADRLGHQDSTETLRTYSHLWPTDEARSRSAIAAGLWA